MLWLVARMPVMLNAAARMRKYLDVTRWSSYDVPRMPT
jgi:hypothetical protein